MTNISQINILTNTSGFTKYSVVSMKHMPCDIKRINKQQIGILYTKWLQTIIVLGTRMRKKQINKSIQEKNEWQMKYPFARWYVMNFICPFGFSITSK